MTIFAVEYVYDAQSSDLRNEHRPAHRQWLRDFVESGRVLSSGPYADDAGALLIFTAESEAALLEELKADPFNAAGVVTGLRVKEWKPVVGAFAEHL